MMTSPFFRELLVVVLSVAGPVAAGWLWLRGRRSSAVGVFLLFAVVMSYLVARWKLPVGL